MEKKPFPPGYRFRPLDGELIVHYLGRKIRNQPLPCDIIHSVALYNYTPDQLAALYGSGKAEETEWYFFTPREKKYMGGSRPNRAVGEVGYWKLTGKDIDAKHKGVTVGLKKTLSFFRGKQPKGENTNWKMHEFIANEDIFPRQAINGDAHEGTSNPMRLDDWVICKIYQTPHDDKNRINGCDFKAALPTSNSQPPSQNSLVTNASFQPPQPSISNHFTNVNIWRPQYQSPQVTNSSFQLPQPSVPLLINNHSFLPPPSVHHVPNISFQQAPPPPPSIPHVLNASSKPAPSPPPQQQQDFKVNEGVADWDPSPSRLNTNHTNNKNSNNTNINNSNIINNSNNNNNDDTNHCYYNEKDGYYYCYNGKDGYYYYYEDDAMSTSEVPFDTTAKTTQILHVTNDSIQPPPPLSTPAHATDASFQQPSPPYDDFLPEVHGPIPDFSFDNLNFDDFI